VGSGSITLGTDNFVFDLNKAFPPLKGNIYIALTGGVESTILAHILTKFYNVKNVIACTYKFGDRRLWEFHKAANIASLIGIRHVEAGYMEKFVGYDTPPTSQSYFNRENAVFDYVRADLDFAAGFTGKNTTTLDPEAITKEEQAKYLEWFEVHRPFLLMDKHHTLDLFYKFNVEYLLEHTHSCQSRGNLHCGDCHACWERIDGFDRLGRRDPAIYNKDYDSLVLEVRKFFKERWPRKTKE
jgi:7-cyano-7-deazaguanine synthase in queuosine biosynthesis